MTRIDHDKVTGLFAEASGLPPGKWEEFLAAACPGESNASVRAEVMSLLNHDTRATPFLDDPAAGAGAAVRMAEAALGQEAGPPVEIAGFTVQRLLGVGGMGAVYEARQARPERTVALKLMRLGSSARAVARFEHEAMMLGRLRHPAIATVYEAGVHQGLGGPTPYFAMEYVEGGRPITAYAADLGVDAKLALFLDVCDAVHHGHQRAIIHRDLKPANILVDSAKRVKVIDFGIARAMDTDERLTTLRTDAAHIVGTLAYASPEQASGEPGAADIRTDVYALGVVLYELLCGRLPYDIAGKSVAAAARMVLEQAPVRPSAVVALLRGDLETIVLKAIAKERGERYQSVAALADDVRRYLSHQPVEARPPSVRYQVRLFTRRHRPLVVTSLIAVVSVAIVLIGATGVSLRFAFLARQRADQAERAGARAAKVAEFLRGALGSANPRVPSRVSAEAKASDYEPWDTWRQSPWAFAGKPGEKAAVTDVLNAAAARLETEFADDAETRADLSQTLGESLFSLGEYPSARKVLESAVTLHREVLGADDARTIQSVLRLAELCDNDASPERAAELYSAALESCRRVYGRFDARSLHVERSLANAERFLLFRGEASEKEIEETLAQAEAAGRAETPAMYQNMAYLAVLKADPRAGLALAQRALEGSRKTAGERSVFAAYAMQRLGHVLQRLGRPDETAALAAGALEIWLEAFGPESLEAGETLALRVNALMDAGRFVEAAPEARRLHIHFLRLRGRDDWHTHSSRTAYMRCAALGKTTMDDALTLGAQGLETLRGAGPLQRRMLWVTTLWQASLLRATGRTEEGLRLLDEFPVTDGPGAEEREIRAATCFHRGTLLFALGRRDEARIEVVECLSVARGHEALADVVQRAEALQGRIERGEPGEEGAK